MHFLNIDTHDEIFISIHFLAPFFHIKVEAGKKSHQLRELTALAEDLGWVPRSHIVTWDLMPLLTSVSTYIYLLHIDSSTQTHIHIK